MVKSQSKSNSIWKYEANFYIEELKKEFGSFNLAPENVLLNANQVERHLYDMIPNKVTVPPQNLNSTPAKALTKIVNSEPSSTFSVANENRIMTRRMSMAIGPMMECDAISPPTQQRNSQRQNSHAKETPTDSPAPNAKRQRTRSINGRRQVNLLILFNSKCLQVQYKCKLHAVESTNDIIK